MSNSFPIQKKWLDDVKDTMKAEEFAELNYRINIYALYGEEVALTDNRYVQGYFNSIKSQIDNMNKKYKHKQKNKLQTHTALQQKYT